MRYQLRRLKYWWQKRTRGYSAADMWSLDTTLARFILPRLKYFRSRTHGYPTDFETPEAWDEALGEMIWAFEWILDEAHGMYGISDTYHEDCDRAMAGTLLFGKYFMALWD